MVRRNCAAAETVSDNDGVMLGTLVLYCLAITPKATSTWSALDYYEAADVSVFSSLRLLAWFSGRLFSTAHWVPPLAVYKQQAWEVYFGASALAGWFAVGWYYRKLAVTWILWIVLGLSPFLVIPEDLVLKFLPGGPSRYLYIASAGSSVLIALALVRLGVLAGKWKGVFLPLVTVLACVSSYAGIKRVEGISHYTSARHYLASGNAEEGIYRLRRAIDEGGHTIPLQDAYERLVLALMVEPEEAEAVVKEGLGHFPDSISINLYRLVLESLSGDAARRNDAQQQLDALVSVAETRDVIGMGYFMLASGFNRRGQVSEALATYKRSLYFLPDKPGSLREYGKALVLQGRFEEAIVVLEHLAVVDTTDYIMLYTLGRLYSIEGNTARARQLFDEALQVAPDGEEADAVRKLLGEL